MDLLVAADDRTGAYETAAVLADRLGEPVPVTAWPMRSARPVSVIDLGTRHLSPADARNRLGDLSTPGRVGLKIDSTLRGNWPDEIVAFARNRPVLLIPALPELARTCVDGIVLEHGRPVHQGDAGTDVRRRVTSSRPADALMVAGEQRVVELADASGVESWLQRPGGVAIADAADQESIDRLVDFWRNGPADVVLSGTSAVIGVAPGGLGGTGVAPVIDGPILVVCGSVHPIARAQLEVAEREGMPVSMIADAITAGELAAHGEAVLASEIPVGDVDEPMAVAAASALAAGVAALRRQVALGAVVIIGGDTAAAVIGDAHVMVRGSVVPGTAVLTVDGFEQPVITRSGGFGSERALVELVRGTLRS